MARDLSAKLLDWYDAHARQLPWRAMPGVKPDPYRVWLSEIMLQQTNVTTVKPYFEEFTRRWPKVEDLAKAPREEIMQAWAGLGYYARARNLHACAIKVAEELGGKFPRTREGLLNLPGIGPYTAGAIAAIAFDLPHAAVDGNVERVLSRLYALTTPLPDVKPEIRQRAEALVPQKRAGDFAQSLMDLGATICTPRNPDCRMCPWAKSCQAKALGLAESLPAKRPKQAPPQRHGIAWWIEKDDALLLRMRADKGLLGGMLEMPSSGWSNEDAHFQGEDTGLRVDHVFTHFRLELAIHKAKAPRQLPGPSYQWIAKADLANAALPSVMRKAVQACLGPEVLKKKRPRR